jgi:SHS2 domain-containing protein
MRYKILSHTADLRLRVYGENHEELFVNAAIRLANIMLENAEKLERRARGHKKIVLNSSDYNSLLVNFLNKIIFEAKTEKKIFPRVKILRISPRVVEAQLFGVPVNEFDKKINLVDGVEIKEKGRKLEVVLDIQKDRVEKIS